LSCLRVVRVFPGQRPPLFDCTGVSRLQTQLVSAHKKYLDLGFSRPTELKIACNAQANLMHRREGLEGIRSLHPLHIFVCACIASHRFFPGPLNSAIWKINSGWLRHIPPRLWVSPVVTWSLCCCCGSYANPSDWRCCCTRELA
jgi:hypothetical protein